MVPDSKTQNRPTWGNEIRRRGPAQPARCRAGHHHLHQPGGKTYSLAPLRRDPDGAAARLALDEKHVDRGRAPISAALFDFGLLSFHNAAALIREGTGPIYSKLESHLEARPLERCVQHSRRTSSAISRGTIRATVLIETIPRRVRMTRSSTS